VTSEEFRWPCILNLFFLPRNDHKHIKHLVPLPAWRILFQEALRHTHLFSKFVNLRSLCHVRSVADENKHFEARVCWKEVLQLDGTGIGNADEDLGDYTLSDDEVFGNRLMFGVDDRRLRVVDTNPTSESAEGLKRSVV